MSKISYCSLEEAWGPSFSNKTIQDTNENNNKDTNNKDNNKENNNKISIRNDDKYNILYKKSEDDRDNVINNMNSIEKHNNNSEKNIIEYNKYRLNSNNQVKNSNQLEEDSVIQKYMPFSESIEKKYLEDKLKFLENEILKYKYLFDKQDLESNDNNYIENFSNQNNSQSRPKTNDLIDLILLIIIGLIIILVMNSIFNIGKAIGIRNR